MTPTLPTHVETNIALQDTLDDTLSSPPGTETIPPVRTIIENAPTESEAKTATLSQASQQAQKIPIWVYFSFASAAVLSVAYWFKS